MKVNWGKKEMGKCIAELATGSTFLAKRKGLNGITLYMVLGKNSDIFLERYERKIMAVNLSSGQIRAFPEDAKVQAVEAEVNLSNFILKNPLTN